jgi:hypothetical protein
LQKNHPDIFKRRLVMKILRIAALSGLLFVFAFPQTKDLGQNTFSSDQGPIILVVDAGLANLKLDSPYIMFVAYMGAKNEQNMTISRDDVVMVYNGQEHKMPSLKELRENYKGQNNDRDIDRHLGKEGVIASAMRFYQFRNQYDFFPVLGPRSTLPGQDGSISGYIGFKTRLYFKNPGFKKGDKLLIKVRDMKSPDLNGEVEVTLK